MMYLLQSPKGDISVAALNHTGHVIIPPGYSFIGKSTVVNPDKLVLEVCVFNGAKLVADPVKQAAYNELTKTTQSEKIVESAADFGKKLIIEFGAENMRLGITQAGKTNSVRKALSEVMSALNSGSLYDAITEVRALPPAAKDPIFVTDARLLLFINKIEDYLKKPRSTSL